MVEPSPFISFLQNCRKKKDLEHARYVHAYICNNGAETSSYVGNYVVPMFVDCGSMPDAQQAFNKLLYRNEHSWTSLISGYVGAGQSQHALNLYQKMQEDSVNPSCYTLMVLLRACGRTKDIVKGRQIQVEIREKGFERDIFIGNTLVHMYARCGSLVEAREAFEKLPTRDVVTWNVLIAGYAEIGLGHESLECYNQMQHDNVCPNAVTFIWSLKACAGIRAIDKGREMQIEIFKRGLEGDVFVGNSLVDMHAKCGSLKDAQEVFDKLPARDIVTWNVLITGYVENGLGHRALKCFDNMHSCGVSPDAVTFLCILKACGCLGAIDKGREIHAHLSETKLETDVVMGNALVGMYAKCGSVKEAQQVFEKLPFRDIVSWNTLIMGYGENGFAEDVLECFQHMHLEGVHPDSLTFGYALKACGSLEAIDKGREIHKQAEQSGFNDLFVSSTLVEMYVKCGLLVEAHDLFDGLPVRDVVTWNLLIAGYSDNGLVDKALECFELMQQEGMRSDIATYISILKACAVLQVLNKGREIHTEIIRKDFGSDIFILNTLIDMYAKCGSFADAQETFDKLPVRNVVSWNVLIAGYADNGLGNEALQCFDQMLIENIFPDSVTFVCVLRICGNVGNIIKGRNIHLEIARKGFEDNLLVGNALIDMYYRCGSYEDAQETFDKMSVRDIVSWSTLIAGYVENGLSKEALCCFEKMQVEGFLPNAVTFVSGLKACGNIGAIVRGQEMHDKIVQQGFERDIFVGVALVDMYVKSGSLSAAKQVFDTLPNKNLIIWNAMLRGYSINHQSNLAIKCFADMQESGIQPDNITFVCLLATCSRGGFLVKGWQYLKLMRENYDIQPSNEHYTCMVDLLARSGCLHEALKLLELSTCTSKETWIALLSACKIYKEPEIGFRCFLQLVKMHPEHSASYVLMANI